MRKRIGIFGGSFNPPHKGHVEICRILITNNDVDEIWVIPCFKHPFAKELAPFEDRLNMCRFAFTNSTQRTRVLDVEKKLGGISHTVTTLEYLQHHHPDYKFYLIMGSDTAAEAKLWKDADKIASLVQFLPVSRGPQSKIPDISSTDVRMAIKNGKPFKDLVPNEVAIYIVTHDLYGG